MSLLSRNGVRARRGVAGASGVAVLCAAGTLVAPAARAAQFFYQPVMSLSTAYNTNKDLDPTNRQKGEGYFADAATFIGIATPTSQTTLQPRLLYNYYPGDSLRNRLEEFFNFNSDHNWKRDRFNIRGLFDHRDDVNAEQPSAVVNPVTPGLGNTTPTTGLVRVGTTRTLVVVDPTYTHLITPLSRIGVSGEYQRLTFSPSDTAGHVSFNYYTGRAFYSWTHDPRTEFAVGAFGSRYVASNVDANSTAGGVSGNAQHSWSQTLQSELSVSYQRVNFNQNSTRVVSGSANAVGAELSTVYSAATASYRASLGRTVGPSAAGGLFQTDQLRGQYDRDLSERLHFTGALLYFRDQTISGAGGGGDPRQYLTTNVKLQWMMTQRIFLAGAYSYAWQKYRSLGVGADANVVSVSIGYRGLERQH